jgi:hypothetical protein
MELKVGMKLYDKKHNIVLVIVDLDIDKICVYSKSFTGNRKLSLSVNFIQHSLKDGRFRIIRNRKNNFW